MTHWRPSTCKFSVFALDICINAEGLSRFDGYRYGGPGNFPWKTQGPQPDSQTSTPFLVSLTVAAIGTGACCCLERSQTDVEMFRAPSLLRRCNAISNLSKCFGTNYLLSSPNLSKLMQNLRKGLTTNINFPEPQRKGATENKLDSVKSDIKKLKDSKEILQYRVILKKNEELLLNSSIWTANSTLALKVSQDVLNIKSKLKELSSLDDSLKTATEFFELGYIENDSECLQECNKLLEEIEERLKSLDILLLMNGKYDKNNCYVTILAGVGGEDSFDFCSILFKKYSQWATSVMNMKIYIIEQNDDEHTGGYRSITFKVDGEFAYGYMKADAGVHRLIRISPFDPQEKRHTSFAQVLVCPDVDDANGEIRENVTINSNDIRIDTYRSSGPGGQNVQKTDSAVRLTHIPTNTVVISQNERSQHLNKKTALSVLRSKLIQLEIEKSNKIKQAITIGGGGSNWGNQIKTITLQPYCLVKDHRTGWETNIVGGYINGDKQVTDAMIASLKFEFQKNNSKNCE